MRLAGTCSRYSNKANPQLSSAATIHGLSASCFKCAYHANVMNTFESVNRMTARTTADIDHLTKFTATRALTPIITHVRSPVTDAVVCFLAAAVRSNAIHAGGTSMRCNCEGMLCRSNLSTKSKQSTRVHRSKSALGAH